jgi:hypothetical protein
LDTLLQKFCQKCSLKAGKEPGVMGVKNKRCRCGLSLPSFGLEGGKAVCCGKCKEPGMMDVINKRCRCGLSQPSFGLEGGKAGQ